MTPQPFEIAIPPSDLDDLRLRLDRTRWADDFANDDWRYGVERGWLQEMVRYWRDDYDWRATERTINATPNFKVEIDDVPLHFMHAKGKGPNPTPLILLHGWPWTFMDFHAMVGPLSDPAAHGGDPADAFDVIVPSLPGFGFSMPLTRTGLTIPKIAGLFKTLMTDALGYDRFAVAGGDWGAAITNQIAHAYPEHVLGMFATIPIIPGLNIMEFGANDFGADEQWMVARKMESARSTMSHMIVNMNDPQTLAYALVDSPVGTAAWLWERRRSWSDCGGDLLSVHSRDFLCTLASINWLTGSIGTSLRIYWDGLNAMTDPRIHHRDRVIEVPAGYAIHPKEVMLVPHAVAGAKVDLRRWAVMPRGGHFGFAEQPVPLIGELRSFFHPLRAA